MKRKNRKAGIKVKIIIPTTLVVIGVCIGMAWIFKGQMAANMISTGGQVAEYIAARAVAETDGNLVEKIPENGENSAPYNAVKNSIVPVIEKAPVTDMYLLHMVDGRIHYMMDLKEENPIPFGTEYEQSDKALEQAFMGETVYDQSILTTEAGAVITVYVPIYNRVGEQVGVLGCDYDANSVAAGVNQTMTVVIIVGTVCVLLACFLFHVIISRITRSLGNVDKCIYDIANSNGDLSRTIEVRSGDEVEIIAGHVNELLVYMREVMTSISDSSVKLNDSSENVVFRFRNTQENVMEVSATMEEMNAMMEGTSESTKRINESINEVYRFIESINGQANEGGGLSAEIKTRAQEIREKAILEQTQVREEAVKISESVYDKLEKSKAVEQISKLTSDIISITDQTNLLSLNASIEAARAGDAGRGFAVVASEIGKLAADSAAAAEQVQRVSTDVMNAVNELAKEASAMVKFMEETAMQGYSELVQTSEEYSTDAVRLDNIMVAFGQQSEELKRNVDDICQSMENVSESVEESVKGVNRVTEMSVNITENVSDIGRHAEENKEIAGRLELEVNKFKL
ncbi:MAG: methyl-accepting chemotaxis protein [Blautia sp.]|nr:methyl-accepting chemotaxis protein [Lachnoclostridium sp.]MCM1210743.1 methyl-accepting chemotaxis protein [Blautia sp.]